jgi:Domain of unknown function (DUF1707)
MAGPENEIAAGAEGRDHLRASHADREQVIGTLKAAFVQGMLAKDEFDLRVGQAFASRTYADLAALTTDLPAGPVTQPRKPARAQGKARVLRTGAVLTASTALYAAMWPLAFSIHRNIEGNPIPYDGKLILMSTLLYLFVLLFLGVRILADRQDKRSGGHPPRRPAPGAGGQASRRPPSAGAGGELPPPGHQHTAEAAPIRRPRRPLLPGWRPRDTSRIRHGAALHQPSPAANPGR